MTHMEFFEGSPSKAIFNLPETLRTWMEEKGYSYADVNRFTLVSRSTLHRIVHGKPASEHVLYLVFKWLEKERDTQ